MNEAGWRSQRRVLVVDAHAVGMIAAIRSLGRAGYRVVGASSRATALGLRSTFCSDAVVHPPYQDPAFLPWLRRALSTKDIDAIVPSEGFLLAIRGVFEEIQHLLPFSPGREVTYRALSKTDVLMAFRQHRAAGELLAHVPAFRIIDSLSPLDDSLLASELAAFGLPVWIKADGLHGIDTADGEVKEARTLGEAVGVISELRPAYTRVLVQSHVRMPVQVGVNLLIDSDRVVARSMMRAVRESPHTGGLTALRGTWWHESIYLDSVHKARALGWTGVAMFEYRYDPSVDEFAFIEMNARFWAALHLDLHAGLDFPRLLVDAHFDRRASGLVHEARLGVLSRLLFPADWGHLLSKVRDPNTSVYGRMRCLRDFVWAFFDPRIRDDFRFEGDSRLMWMQWRALFERFTGSVSLRSPKQRGRNQVA
jgi:hypothetical protein